MARKNKKTGEVMKRKVVYEDVPDLGESIELLEQFYNVKYTHNQVEAINYGLWLNVEVEAYAHPQYDDEQMRTLFEALKKGIDPGPLTDPVFTAGQMREILYGIENGIAIEKYANPNIDEKWMLWLRRALQKNIDIDAYPEFSKGRFPAQQKYLEITNERREACQNKKQIIRVERIRKEAYFMEVKAEDQVDVDAVLRRLNEQKLQKIRSVEDALNAEGIYSIERKLLNPVGRVENYIQFLEPEKV